jgi:hypothetical protein
MKNNWSAAMIPAGEYETSWNQMRGRLVTVVCNEKNVLKDVRQKSEERIMKPQ